MSKKKSSQVVKSRIQQLKKLSYDLKQFKDISKQDNYETLKQIIQSSNRNSNEKVQTKPIDLANTIYSKSYHEDIPDLFDTPNNSSLKKIQRVASQQYQKVYKNENIEEIISPGSPDAEKKSHEDLEQLRNENIQLQQSLQKLRKQLNNYHSINQTSLQDNWKQGIPYFRINQQIGAYFTQVTISQNEYAKIKYKLFNVKLEIDKLCLKKGIKGKQKVYQINNIKEVFYHEDQFMVLHFKESGNDQQSLFLKFKDQENRHKWDLGIYINFKIMQSLSKTKISSMVSENKLDNQNKDQQLKQMLSSGLLSYSKDDDRQEQQQLIKQKNIEQQQQNLLNYQNQKEKISRIKEQLSAFQDLEKKKLQQLSDQKEQKTILDQFEQEKDSEKYVEDDMHQINSPSLQKFQSSKYIVNTFGKGFDQQDDSSDKFADFGSPIKKNNQVRYTQRSQDQHPNFAWKDKIYKLQQAKQELSSGCILTKYAQGGWNPHKKFIYFNKDDQTLNFRDEEKKNDLKIIKIREIISIKPGFIGNGIKKHVDPKDLIPQNFVVLQLKKKVIELGSQQAQRVKQFTELLSYLHKQITGSPQNNTQNESVADK